VGGLGIDAKEGERSQIIQKKKIICGVSRRGGHNSSWRGQKKGENEGMEGD
jgi:hypothetical protein